MSKLPRFINVSVPDYYGVMHTLDWMRSDIADELLKALEALLDRDERNTCQHEETHRGGAIWEICDSCGMRWSDDRNPKPEWQDPEEWVKARAAIAKAKGDQQ